MALKIRVRFYVGHTVQGADGETVREHDPNYVRRIATEALAEAGIANSTALAAVGTWNGIHEPTTVFEHVADGPEANDMANAVDPYGPAGNRFRSRMLRAARLIADRLEQSEVFLTFDVVDAFHVRSTAKVRGT